MYGSKVGLQQVCGSKVVAQRRMAARWDLCNLCQQGWCTLYSAIWQQGCYVVAYSCARWSCSGVWQLAGCAMAYGQQGGCAAANGDKVGSQQRLVVSKVGAQRRMAARQVRNVEGEQGGKKLGNISFFISLSKNQFLTKPGIGLLFVN